MTPRLTEALIRAAALACCVRRMSVLRHPPLGPTSTRCRLLVLLAAFVALAHVTPALATTTIGATTYSSNTTWTSAGSPYWVTGTVTVNNGATLTVQPGVIVKFSNSTAAQLLMSGGKLNAAGTAANPIVFTSIADDSVGGDTGGDGPTTGSAGTWCNLAFTNSGSNVGLSSSLSYATVRYAGKGYVGQYIHLGGKLGVMVELIGVQFLSLGLIGEVVARIYFESQGKPPYVVRERRNLAADPARRAA